MLNIIAEQVAKWQCLSLAFTTAQMRVICYITNAAITHISNEAYQSLYLSLCQEHHEIHMTIGGCYNTVTYVSSLLIMG